MAVTFKGAAKELDGSDTYISHINARDFVIGIHHAWYHIDPVF